MTRAAVQKPGSEAVLVDCEPSAAPAQISVSNDLRTGAQHGRTGGGAVEELIAVGGDDDRAGIGCLEVTCKRAHPGEIWPSRPRDSKAAVEIRSSPPTLGSRMQAMLRCAERGAMAQ